MVTKRIKLITDKAEQFQHNLKKIASNGKFLAEDKRTSL